MLQSIVDEPSGAFDAVRGDIFTWVLNAVLPASRSPDFSAACMGNAMDVIRATLVVQWKSFFLVRLMF